ncbi:MAG: LptF/LptG family permease [Fusobacteriaceae bacterium]|jgi:lipopolysaccharide export system permease protein|nr:LptF/LptG family permease [Fusobacteriaceae bacterium]
MKIMDRYMCKNFIRSFFISLLAFIGIFILSQLFKIMRYVSEGRFTTGEAFTYIVTLLPKILIDVEPIAVLLGSLLTISTMASNLEIISFKTAGISFRRIVIFPVAIAFLLSVGVFVVNDRLYPNAIRTNYKLRDSNDRDEVKVTLTKKNAFVRGEKDNHIYYMGFIDRSTGIGEDIVIIDFNADFNKRERIILAPRGKFDFERGIWELEEAKIYAGEAATPEEPGGIFSDERYTEDPDKFITENVNPKTLSIKQLKKAIQAGKTTGSDTRQMMVELGKRYSFPFSGFICVFLGLALGGRYVKSTSAISIGLCLCLGYGYYVVQGVFESYSKNGMIDAFVAGWIPNILFLIIGLYFMKRAEY